MKYNIFNGKELTKIEFKEKAKYFIKDNKIYEIQDVEFDFKVSLCHVTLITPEQNFILKISFLGYSRNRRYIKNST